MKKIYYYNDTKLVQTAAALATFKVVQPWVAFPLRDCYALYAKHNGDSAENKILFFRVANRLGWNVCRKGSTILENGVKIWDLTSGC